MNFESLIARAQKGDAEARNQVIKDAEKILRGFVAAYRRKNLGFSRVTDFDDNMQYARVCCDNCVDKFDNERNTKFTTYLWDALRFHFSNLRRRENAHKRRLNHIAKPIVIEGDDGEERIREIPNNMHNVLFETVVINEFLDSLSPELENFVKDLLAGKTARSKRKLRQLKEVKEQFYKFFPEYEGYFKKKIFEERLKNASKIIMFKRRWNVSS